MDVDRPPLVHYSTGEQSPNAEAGPSTQPVIPVVWDSPPGPPSRLPPFDSTQDLIARFQLLPAYDKYVRPHIRSAFDVDPVAKSSPASAPTPAVFQAMTPGGVDKGKGKEVLVGTPMAAPTPGAGDGGDGDGDDEDGGKGDKKKKNNYKHLIKGVPGKHSMKKDDYLQTMMLAPSKQKMSIAKLDVRTQREAFSVSLEGLKGWNINALVAESAQAREDRKKRKELKKLAKAQAQAASTGHPPPGGSVAPQSTISPTSTSGPSAAHAPTPPGGAAPRRPQTPSSVGTPRSVPAPPHRGGSRPPGSGPGPPSAHTRPNTPTLNAPSSVPTPRPAIPTGSAAGATSHSLASDPFMIKRGKKREHEDNLGVGTSGAAGASAQKRPVTGAAAGAIRAGLDGVRPRPVKKPRTDSNGHPPIGIPLPQQQPTPQGV